MLLPWSENLNDDVYGEDSLIKNRNPYQIFLTSASRYVAQTVSACSPRLNFKLMSMLLNLLKSTKFVKEYIDNTFNSKMDRWTGECKQII